MHIVTHCIHACFITIFRIYCRLHHTRLLSTYVSFPSYCTLLTMRRLRPLPALPAALLLISMTVSDICSMYVQYMYVMWTFQLLSILYPHTYPFTSHVSVYSCILYTLYCILAPLDTCIYLYPSSFILSMTSACQLPECGHHNLTTPLLYLFF